MSMKKTLSIALATFMVCSFANATVKDLEKTLVKQYPASNFSNIEETKIKGIYEVTLGKNIAYTDVAGKYFLFGNMVDMATQTDLTAEKREALDKVDFNKLPFDKAIKIVKGKGERQIAVFSDPDCPFCKRLEQEIQKLDNVTVYIFLNPLKQLHPKAIDISKQIWCSKDRGEAWEDYMLGGIAPTATTTCDNPVDETVRLAQRMGFTGTPMSILVDGTKIMGAKSASELNYALTRSAEKAKQAKQTKPKK